MKQCVYFLISGGEFTLCITRQIFMLREGFGRRSKLDIGERKWREGEPQLRGEEGLDSGFEGKATVKFVCLSIYLTWILVFDV